MLTNISGQWTLLILASSDSKTSCHRNKSRTFLECRILSSRSVRCTQNLTVPSTVTVPKALEYTSATAATWESTATSAAAMTSSHEASSETFFWNSTHILLISTPAISVICITIHIGVGTLNTLHIHYIHCGVGYYLWSAHQWLVEQKPKDDEKASKCITEPLHLNTTYITLLDVLNSLIQEKKHNGYIGHPLL